MLEEESTQESKPYAGDLTAMEAASAMQAARFNARDLLETAEILYDLKRFAHSIVLSTLAIEEAGKVPLLQAIFLGFGGDRSKLWKAYRQHQAKTQTLNPGIYARVRAVLPEVPPNAAKEIGMSGPTPRELETAKQKALYSDCVQLPEGFVCHLPRNLDWRQEAWDRLCEAQVLVFHLRDYPPEELEVWLKHAREAQARGGDVGNMLVTLQRELVEKGFINKGSWDKMLAELQDKTWDGTS
jgi:AbiV family abortive infection protein